MSDLPRTALVLAGGRGTRLASVVADRPKVLAPVLGRPFAAWLLDQLADFGLKRVILCTGYQASVVEQTLGRSWRGMQLEYSRESTTLGTGGALRLAAELLDEDTALALNGDSYCDTDLEAFAAWHVRSRMPMSLVATHVADTSRFGTIETDRTGRVTAFVEKTGAPVPGWINAGIYLFATARLREVAPGVAVSLEREVLPLYVGQSLGAWPGGRRFVDIGTPDSYARVESFFAQPRKAG